MPRIASVLILAVAVAGVLAAGCTDPPHRIGPVAVVDFGPTLEGAMCDWVERCSGNGGCDLSRLGESAEVQRLEQAVAAGKLTYDPAVAGQCIGIFEAASCSEGDLAVRIIPDAPDAPIPCQWAFQGAVAADGACAFDRECRSGRCLIPSTCQDACCTGTCAGPDPAPGPGAIGSACTAAGCVDGASCVDGLCLPAYLPAGSACQQDGACALGLICAGDPLVCRQPVIAGDACIREAGNGRRCGSVGVTCNDALQCVQRPVPAVGQPCTDQCVEGAHCVATGADRTCVKLVADGGACTTADDCVSYTCDATTHTCVAAPRCL